MCIIDEMWQSNFLALAVPEVTLGGHSSGTLTIPRCKIGIRPWPGNSELTLRIITHKQEQITGNDGPTLALKPMGRVNHSLKQRISVAPQDGDLSPQKCFLKNFKLYSIMSC